MNNSLDIFIKNFRDLAKLKGLEHKEIAEKAGMLPAQLSKYLTGTSSPSLPVIDRLAAALEVKPSDLIDDGFRAEHWDHPIDECARRVCELVEASLVEKKQKIG